MNDSRCTLHPVTASATCEVHTCAGCGAVHLTVGPLTWRFHPQRFLELARTLAEAATLIRAMRFGETEAGAGFGLPGSTRPQ